MPLFVVPLAVQWWAAWYPGAEPGGGGYIAQRMLAAKTSATPSAPPCFFNVAHYALRPWPWILVALCSLVVFPDLESLRPAFPHVDPKVVIATTSPIRPCSPSCRGAAGAGGGSLAAAYMSTISTHLNWGSSYVTHDVYRRFVEPQATERELVLVGRISTVVLMAAAAGLALLLENALQAFQILLQIGAGTGLLFILRWFWWRINAWSELTAMVVSFAVALGFFFQHRVQAAAVERLVGSGLDRAAAETQVGGLESWQELLIGVALTTVCWLAACWLTRPTNEHTLRAFYRLTRPGGPGWQTVVERAARDGEILDDGKTPWSVPGGLVCMLAGCLGVYAALFATGYWLYGEYRQALVLVAVAVGAGLFLIKTCKNAAGERPSTTPLSTTSEEQAEDE